MKLVLVPERDLPIEPPPTPPRLVVELPELVELGGEGRLRPPLRAAAQTRDALAILARAALAGRGGDVRLARALAELAATGRFAVTSLRAARTRLGSALGTTVAETAAANEPPDAALRAAAEDAVRHAAHVEAYLLAPEDARAALRRAHPELGRWLAVSSEDDPPHRPVNLDTVSGGAITDETITVPWRTRTVDVVARVFDGGPRDGRVLVFLHGHGSRLEECGGIAPHLLGRYRVLAFDLPSCGYTERVPVEELDEFPSKPDEPSLPLLEFFEAFTDALLAHLGVTEAWVAGGSLGGNLALRALKRRPAWLRGAVAWSAGSVWTSALGDPIRYLGLANLIAHARRPETEERRKEFFQNVFDDSIPSPVIPRSRPQPTMWYSDDWRPYRDWMIEASRAERREVYGPTFRRWHWLVAREELVYSHVDPFVPVPSPLLLLSGEKDDFAWSNICTATKALAEKLAAPPATRGEALIPSATGHSIHTERPKWLASRIAAFMG